MEESIKIKNSLVDNKKMRFGTESIPKLLVSLAVPAIIANLVNALYNIVDQIFIGQKIGFLGNAATNVAFPLTTICLAIGLMTGVGAATNFNLELGRKRPKRAKSVAGTAVTMLLLGGIILCILINIFLKPMLTAFGATNQIFDYAIEYTRITSLGIPFLLFSIGANPLVRADGNAFYSMLAIVVGSLVNTILDPLFMFGFDMGMDGAAWATVIGQFVSAVMLALYFFRFKSVKFELRDFKIRIREIGILFALGTSPFIFQCSALIIQIVTNNLLKIYGAKSIYGSEIPIAVAGIVMKINVIFIAIVLGLTQGAQPIAGYNYGARKYTRVREILKLTLKAAFVISIVAFAIFQIFPVQIISVFGSGNELYFKYGTKYMRIFLFFIFLNGIQGAITLFLTSIGRAFQGAVLSLVRQIISLLPLLIILPYFMGVDGIMFAFPIADLVAFIVSVIILKKEMKKIPKLDEDN
ncbi:MATE family efflux transporter [Leptotrichia massiliensis]|uniref:MATE family efflux transporter n=1 Tax=Leptotrichia massiliensis TaxID=1852388 RepID=UPI0036F37853